MNYSFYAWKFPLMEKQHPAATHPPYLHRETEHCSPAEVSAAPAAGFSTGLCWQQQQQLWGSQKNFSALQLVSGFRIYLFCKKQDSLKPDLMKNTGI